MMDNVIQNYLIESLKQNDDYYKNIINASHPYPCGICQKNVNNNQKAIECSLYKFWIHIKCNGTTNEEYNKMMDSNSKSSDAEIDAKECCFFVFWSPDFRRRDLCFCSC